MSFGIDFTQVAIIAAVGAMIGTCIHMFVTGAMKASTGASMAVTAIAMVPVLILVRPLVVDLEGGDTGRDEIHAGLEKAAAAANRTLPQKLDSYTNMTKATVAGTTLTFHYTLDLPPAVAHEAKARVTNMLQLNGCDNQNFAAAVRAGATIVYSYQTDSGTSLYDVPITHCP